MKNSNIIWKGLSPPLPIYKQLLFVYSCYCIIFCLLSPHLLFSSTPFSFSTLHVLSLLAPPIASPFKINISIK